MMQEGALTAFVAEERVTPESEILKTPTRIRSLGVIFGQKTEEVETLKEAVHIARQKTHTMLTADWI